MSNDVTRDTLRFVTLPLACCCWEPRPCLLAAFPLPHQSDVAAAEAAEVEAETTAAGGQKWRHCPSPPQPCCAQHPLCWSLQSYSQSP
eukprot:951698-Pelagomonas_calceolata.AAC.8